MVELRLRFDGTAVRGESCFEDCHNPSFLFEGGHAPGLVRCTLGLSRNSGQYSLGLIGGYRSVTGCLPGMDAACRRNRTDLGGAPRPAAGGSHHAIANDHRTGTAMCTSAWCCPIHRLLASGLSLPTSSFRLPTSSALACSLATGVWLSVLASGFKPLASSFWVRASHF